jgi:hypothetical protein
MDSSRSLGIMVPARVYGGLEHNEREESEMNATTVAVDLAKSVFELAVADGDGAGWRQPAVFSSRECPLPCGQIATAP